MRRIGIYGGSFSPPHNGHIEAVKSFQEAMVLDKVLVMPTFIAPHKQTAATVASHHRYEMARRAFAPLDYVTVSDYEISRQTVSYTANTLKHFSLEGELFFLCGSDMLLTMDTWHRPDIIFENATIVLASRDASLDAACLAKKKDYEERFAARIVILQNKICMLSSTDVREAIANHKPIHDLVPSSVEAYIQEHRLYE